MYDEQNTILNATPKILTTSDQAAQHSTVGDEKPVVKQDISTFVANQCQKMINTVKGCDMPTDVIRRQMLYQLRKININLMDFVLIESPKGEGI